jgi:hypothetical protein
MGRTSHETPGKLRGIPAHVGMGRRASLHTDAGRHAVIAVVVIASQANCSQIGNDVIRRIIGHAGQDNPSPRRQAQIGAVTRGNFRD